MGDISDKTNRRQGSIYFSSNNNVVRIGVAVTLFLLFVFSGRDPGETSHNNSISVRGSAPTHTRELHWGMNPWTVKDNYVDCAGTPFAEIDQNFKRDGAVMFTPCRFKVDDGNAAINRIVAKMDDWCGTNYEGNSCENRVVKHVDDDIMSIATDPEIKLVIDWLHNDRKSFPFQTLNFKWGTRQNPHSDLIHFAGVPSMTLTAAWVAFEDIHADAGPLEYYLGSHTAKFETMESLGCPHGAYQSCYQGKLFDNVLKPNLKEWRPISMLPKKGDVVIWASNVLHGGTPVNDSSLTRLSQVTHYFFEDDDLYIAPKLSHLTGDLSTSKFAMRVDVPLHAKADEMTMKHWNSDHIKYQGHYPSYFKDILYDYNGVALQPHESVAENS